tara:strand:+ start:807 stop:2114 length:1308 start_codon:yes stop_codon:yes gene_type:complete
MKSTKVFFKNKKILIYGYGKTGKSAYNFLKKKNYLKVFDDKLPLTNLSYNEKFAKGIDRVNNFDYILLSPGIDYKKCTLSNEIIKNKKKIITDLDVFYKSFPENFFITITGTNGKSTTCKILYQVFRSQKIDTKLVGNIGKSILSNYHFTKKTLFVVEASSYQIEYSKYYKTNLAVILNVSIDHLERHGNFKNYVKSKIKLILMQNKNSHAFIEKKNKIVDRIINEKKISSKILRVNEEIYLRYQKLIKNNYLNNSVNKKNLIFILNICKFLKIDLKKIIPTLNKFKALRFRNEIIINNKKLKVINDSKSTSFSSTQELIDTEKKTFWILGGLPKKGDKFTLSKKDCLNLRAYIFGKNANFFEKRLKDKVRYQKFNNMISAIKKIKVDLKKEQELTEKIVLFSPASASFDKFKNFEDRGRYFNFQLRKIGISGKN